MAVHATHLANPDFAVLANATCCLCPTTERDLADGVGPARRLADAGARLALGSDSNAVIDMFEEARAVELDERLAGASVAATPRPTCFTAATAGGHACLGWPEAGRIEPGAFCDLVAIDLDSVRLAGADRADLLPALVFAGAAADVREVVAGGRRVVSEGQTREHRRPSGACRRDRSSLMSTLVVDRIGLLVTNDPELGEGPLGIVRDAALVIDGDRVAAVEPAGAAADDRLDAAGRCVIPGFVDSHTHLVFAGDRAEEFAARMAGNAVRGRRDQRHDRSDPRRVRRRAARTDRAPPRRGAAGRHHPHRDQERLRPRRRD